MRLGLGWVVGEWLISRVWRRSMNYQGVNFCFHHVAQGVVHESVTLKRGFAIKRLGPDIDLKMAFAFTCAGVSYVQVALIFNF